MEWISVKDSLPEVIDMGPKMNMVSDPVLVFNGRISVGVRWIRKKFPGICKEEEYFLSNEEEDRDNITHWMPLPSPPENSPKKYCGTLPDYPQSLKSTEFSEG